VTYLVVLAVQLLQCQNSHSELLVTQCNLQPVLCLAFMAPEVITDSENSGRAADIWSLGCVLIEMATGKVMIAVDMSIKSISLFHVRLLLSTRLPSLS